MTLISNDGLPQDWRWTTIPELVGEAGLFADGDWIESKDQDEDGDVRLIQLADIGDGVFRDRSSRFLTSAKAQELGCTYLEPGDVLIARMPDPLGRSCIFPGDAMRAVTVVDVCIVRSANGSFNHHWLSWFVNAPQFRTAISALQGGSTRKRISRRNLGTIPLPFPPVHEQTRIVQQIEQQFSRLDAGVAALKRVQANLNRYRAAVLKAACEGRLVPTEAELARQEGRDYETGAKLLERILGERRLMWQGTGKYREPLIPNSAALEEIPVGWAWATVDQVTQLALGKMLDKTKHTTGRQLHYLRNINVRWGHVDTENLKLMFFRDEEVERYSLAAGDVLVCEGGEPGRAAVWDNRIPGMMYQKALHRVRAYSPFQSKYLVILLDFLANAGRLDKWFTGSSIKHFTRESFASLPIPVPPAEEQKRILAEVERRLSVVEEVGAAVTSNLQRAARLRQAVLSLLFNYQQVQEESNDTVHVGILPDLTAKSRFNTDGGKDIMIGNTTINPTNSLRDLREILSQLTTPVSPEELFALSGRNHAAIEDIEEFFIELRNGVSSGSIEELRVNGESVQLRVKP